jgi:hypothetical protein
MVLLTATLVFAVAHAVSAAAASVQSGPKPPKCAITEQQVLKFATKYRKDILWSGVAKVPKQRLRKPPKPSKKKSRSLETRADTRTPWQNQASWYWMVRRFESLESMSSTLAELRIRQQAHLRAEHPRHPRLGHARLRKYCFTAIWTC